MSTILFFMGKGGVGKSTVSAITSLHLAMQLKKTLLVSLDPAHNLSDIFNIKLRGRAKKIKDNLSAKEVNEKKLVKHYLKEMEHQLSRTYAYQSAFNLLGYFDIIRHSPGIEEYSLLRAFIDIVDSNNDKDYIIFDMPPTALTMKFFRLPSLSLIWLNKLKDLREKIIEKKELITRIKFGTKEFERDRVLNRINESIVEYEKIHSIFSNTEKTKLNLIINPEKLSFAESLSIKKDLEDIGLRPAHIVLNKYVDNANMSYIKKSFNVDDVNIIYSSEKIPIGLSALTTMVKGNIQNFTFI